VPPPSAAPAAVRRHAQLVRVLDPARACCSSPRWWRPLVGTDDLETLRYLVAVIVVALVGTTLPTEHRLKLPVLLARGPARAGRRRRDADPSLPLLICLPSTTIAAGSPPATSARAHRRARPPCCWPAGSCAR
jgi:hypothetical protein